MWTRTDAQKNINFFYISFIKKIGIIFRYHSVGQFWYFPTVAGNICKGSSLGLQAPTIEIEDATNFSTLSVRQGYYSACTVVFPTNSCFGGSRWDACADCTCTVIEKLIDIFFFILQNKPTYAQSIDKLFCCSYMFRHYCVILRELVVSTLPSYISMSV